MSPKIVKPIKHHDPDVKEWVWEYPVQTEIRPSSQHVQVVWNGEIIANSKRAYRCLELGIAPYYFIPAPDVAMEFFRPARDRTHFEWLGVASYWNVVIKKRGLEQAVLSLTEPSGQYRKLLNYFLFRADLVDQATVDGHLVRPMISEKYMGWVTPDILGPFKSEPGSEDRIRLMVQVLRERGIMLNR